jgi:hypothetical protein
MPTAIRPPAIVHESGGEGKREGGRRRGTEHTKRERERETEHASCADCLPLLCRQRSLRATELDSPFMHINGLRCNPADAAVTLQELEDIDRQVNS